MQLVPLIIGGEKDTRNAYKLIIGTFEQNTTAAIAAASAYIAQFYGKDTLILVLTKNHPAINQYAFEHTISIAKRAAAAGNLVTFGMRYYETNSQYDAEEVEDNNKLQKLSVGGQLLWNSNLFLFKADTILEALSMHRPDVLSATLECLKHCELTEENNSLTIELNPTHPSYIPQCSINEEVIKKFSRTVVLPCGLEWLDERV